MSTVSDNEDDQQEIRPIDGAHPVQLIDSTQVTSLGRFFITFNWNLLTFFEDC